MGVAEWLEPSIKRRIDDLIESSEVMVEPVDTEFQETFNLLLKRHPESVSELSKMESLFYQRYNIVDLAYRTGLKDGISLNK